MAEFDAEFDSDSENIHPYLPYYYLHMLTDAEAESVMASELPGSWILREHPYVITIRIGDGYVHHTDIHIQFRQVPEVLEYDTDMDPVNPICTYLTFPFYLSKLAHIYGLDRKRQIVQQKISWSLKNAMEQHIHSEQAVSEQELLDS